MEFLTRQSLGIAIFILSTASHLASSVSIYRVSIDRAGRLSPSLRFRHKRIYMAVAILQHLTTLCLGATLAILSFHSEDRTEWLLYAIIVSSITREVRCRYHPTYLRLANNLSA